MTSPAVLDELRTATPHLLVAVDFDGTLAPIIRDPQRSRPVPGAVEALQRLADGGAQVAVVTGREAQVAVDLGGLESVPRLRGEGVYGAQHWQAGRLTRDPVPSSVAEARAAVDEVLRTADADPAVWVEDKDVSFVVHTRLTPDPDGEQQRLDQPLGDLARRHGLELHPGKQVLEVRVPGVDKGVTLDRLLAELQPAALVWAGDDLGDLPAFESLRRWRDTTGRPALGVAVRPGPSPDPLAGAADELDPRLAAVADEVVLGPAGFVDLLRQLVG